MFAYWVVVYIGLVIKIYRHGANFWITFSQQTGQAFIVTKNGLGNILGNFFTNSSGHPICEELGGKFLKKQFICVVPPFLLLTEKQVEPML
jgi:hypothetical protein